MKKFLLSAAIIAAAFTAKADYTDFFKVTANGAEVTSGSYLICTNFEDLTDFEDGDNLGYDYDINLVLTNQTPMNQTVTGTMMWDIFPTKEEYLAHKDDSVEDAGENVYYRYWGEPSICGIGTNCFQETEQNLGSGDVTISGPNQGYSIHLKSCPPTLTSEYKIIITPQGNPEDSFECGLIFAPTEEAAKEFLANAAISDIATDNTAAPVRYYNLQGQEIFNPTHGLYIKRQGTKAEKVIL